MATLGKFRLLVLGGVVAVALLAATPAQSIRSGSLDGNGHPNVTR
jgi:hypothetical protein